MEDLKCVLSPFVVVVTAAAVVAVVVLRHLSATVCQDKQRLA